ncbi:MAG: lipoyl(octanoyl) transferase LipB [candidate division Zixibacteria bacterium]|nr:lipoyl(octanoyl) transferase LipB [candidate division Zixibacteria bacterium]
MSQTLLHAGPEQKIAPEAPELIVSNQPPIDAYPEEFLGWSLNIGIRDYGKTLELQRSLIPLRRRGLLRDTLIFVEHPPVVTMGKSTEPSNLSDVPSNIPRFEIERGGDVTFHGPGQLVCYLIFDLNRRGRDLHLFMRSLEEGIIRTLAEYGVEAIRVPDLTGVWVETKNGNRKIASIGVAAKTWVSYHGVAVNLSTDFSIFKTMKPCGLEPNVMTSLEKLTGARISLDEFAEKLTRSYSGVFKTEFCPVTLAEIGEDFKSDDLSGHV